MSLRVWLPLNESLENKGLDDITVTNNGATIDNNGKIGKCYSFVNGYLNLPSSLMSNFKECSICFWININSWNTSYETYFHAGKDSYSWTDYIFGILRNAANSTVCFTIGNGSTASNSNYLTSAWSVGEWMHVAFIYSIGKCKIYLNGNIDKEYDTSIVPDFTKITRITIGHSNGSAYQTNCKMNDFRIYDHALSSLEVKQISRYTQSTGWDTTKNGTQLASSWGGYNGGVSNSSTIYHAHLKEFNGEWVYEYIKTANENWLGISQGGLQSKLIAGKTYTFSWEEYRVEGNNYPTGGLYYFKTGTTSASFYLGQFGGSYGNVLGKWRKFSYTFVAPTDGDYSKNMSWYIYGTSGGNGKMYIRHPKLEEGSAATPWCPNSADELATTMGLNDNVEYDCSGYCNNGTRTGTFSWTSDTPKYNVSTSFNGSAKIERDSLMGEVYTLSCWAKTTKNKSTSQMIVVDSNSQMAIAFYNGTIIGVYGTTRSTGSKCTLSDSNYKENEWNHFVVVKTSSDGKRNIYCNGELLTPSSDDYWSSMPNNFAIGARNTSTPYYFYGEINDVRVYATALSAEDVKDLYELGATIDTNGVLSTYEFTEQ